MLTNAQNAKCRCDELAVAQICERKFCSVYYLLIVGKQWRALAASESVGQGCAGLLMAALRRNSRAYQLLASTAREGLRAAPHAPHVLTFFQTFYLLNHSCQIT